MKRYLVFAMMAYEEYGGMGDYIGSRKTKRGAISLAKRAKIKNHRHWHVLDVQRGRIVAASSDTEIDWINRILEGGQ